VRQGFVQHQLGSKVEQSGGKEAEEGVVWAGEGAGRGTIVLLQRFAQHYLIRGSGLDYPAYLRGPWLKRQ
jgi:hypothetical protein